MTMSLSDALVSIRSITAGEDPRDLLFRGEPKLYPSTLSSQYRLFEGSNQFTPDQAKAVKERLVLIAQALQIVLQEKPLFSSHVDAVNAPPATIEEIHEVAYCFMQHYHLPTPLLDVTTDLRVAVAFAAEVDRDEEPGSMRPGALYVLHKSRLEAHGIRVSGPVHTQASRPKRQKALSLFLAPGVDLQQLPSDVVKRIIFSASTEERAGLMRPDLLDAHDDRVAAEVARLAYRCAYGDWAPEESSAGRIVDFFSKIAYSLADAGALPTRASS